jgi:methanogenic corrinoid protein MtbC1
MTHDRSEGDGVSAGDRPSDLTTLIANLDEARSLALVQARVAAGDDPLTIIHDCQRGMQRIGDLYQSGEYFISGLIMAGEIFREVMSIVEPLISEPTSRAENGTVLLCTVQGDIHDIGKDIVDLLLRTRGIVVHDLGVDVSAAEVARQALALRPDVVGLSGLLTTSHASMRATVVEMRRVAEQLGRPLPVIVGGNQVDEHIGEWTGADHWTNDAVRGVGIIQSLLTAQHDGGKS